MTVVVSNRGPYRFVEKPDGTLEAHPGPGGLASSLRPLLTSGAAGPAATWIAAAIGDGDRAAARRSDLEVPGIHLRLLEVEEHQYRRFNDVVANQTLWFLHHGLFDLPRRPVFDAVFHEAWDAFVTTSRAFADAAAAAAEPGAVVLVQDYQLALVPGMLREQRPDLRVVHFTHTPFCGPNSIRVLPEAVARAVCVSMAGGPSGFHSERWARAFAASAAEVLGRDVVAETFVAPLAPDPDALRSTLDSDAAAEAGTELDELVGDRQLLLRVDRIDPSKNIARGFGAYDLLLERHSELRERVVFVAKLNASRANLPEYAACNDDVEQAATHVNERWAHGDWRPVVIDAGDDYPGAIAALARADVLLVNPIKDGLNLVAKEFPLVNRRSGVLCLSPDAGAWDELGTAAVAVHPFDLEQSAAALHDALVMDPDERDRRARELRMAAEARTPADWLSDLLTAAGAR